MRSLTLIAQMVWNGYAYTDIFQHRMEFIVDIRRNFEVFIRQHCLMTQTILCRQMESGKETKFNQPDSLISLDSVNLHWNDVARWTAVYIGQAIGFSVVVLEIFRHIQRGTLRQEDGIIISAHCHLQSTYL